MKKEIMFRGKKYKAFLTKYRDKDQNALILKPLRYRPDDEIVASVCLVSEEIKNDEVAIKNYSENEGIEKVLIDCGVIKGDPVKKVKSGFVVINVYKIGDI